jgi:orotidine-5'-phosphate decarboxylase
VPSNPSERIVIALDGDSRETLLDLAKRLSGKVGTYKVGLEAFVRWGVPFVEEVQACGPVFLDLKLHDIPNTVAGAANAAGRLGVQLLTIHAAGGREMISAAVEGAKRGAAAAGRPAPTILAVTVLTSLSDRDLDDIGLRGPAADRVPALAKLAVEAGAGGIVCSPLEVARVRAAVGPGPILVTPGIRPAGAEMGDQARAATPASALAAGADRLVIGRPITAAPDPVAAAEKILAEIAAG